MMINLFSTFSRFSVSSPFSVRNISTYINPLYFRVSDVLLGEPLKKKKRLDPAIIKQREDRKKKKLEKQIRMLEKYAKQLKPIEEIEVPSKLTDQKEQRLRNTQLSEEEVDSRILLQKQWTKYKTQQYLADAQAIDCLLYSQQKALDELRMESEELYQEAIQMDLTLLPHITKGPLKTPLIKEYVMPDGEYINTTKKYAGEE